MGIRRASLSRAWVYRLWQSPFAERKLEPILRRGEQLRAQRVLDVGCGPGTNTVHFRHAEYLGVDTNPAYIASASRRHGRPFRVVDVTTESLGDERYDFVFLNSLLHHLDDDASRRLLASLVPRVAPGGSIHILDLVLPRQWGPTRLLARLDRGDHPRDLQAWRSLLTEHFEPEHFEPYGLGVGPLALWSMVYFKGRPRDDQPADS